MSSPTETAAPTSSPPRLHKYVHEMTSAERLQSLKEWAEEKKYVQPGEGGTLPSGSVGGMNAMVFGGPMPVSRSKSQPADKYAGQYDAPVGPPSYRVATREQPREKRRSVVGRWLEKRKAKKEERRMGTAPAYAP